MRFLVIFILILPIGLSAQEPPPAVSAYVSNGVGGLSAWTAASGGGSMSFQPPSVALYCQAAPNGPWTPCLPSSGGSNGFPITLGGTSINSGSNTTSIEGLALTGDISTTPSIMQMTTSTNSGSTSGITSGYGCLIVHTFSAGSAYTSTAECISGGGTVSWWVSSAHALGGEAFTQIFTANNAGATYNIASITQLMVKLTQPSQIYSAAGTALPTCGSTVNGEQAIVSDALTPAFMSVYTSGGTTTASVICSYNGTVYNWLIH